MVWPLPVTDLLYVGHAAKKLFQQFHITTIGDLAVFDRSALFTMLGKNGAQLHDFANGLDDAPVAPAGQHAPPKSVGNGLTFPKNLCGTEEIKAGITMLSDQVAARLRSHNLKCCGVSLAIRDPDFRDISRQKQINTPTNLSREIAGHALELALGCWRMSEPVRAMTITALALIPEDEAVAQLDLLGDNHQKREKLERLESAMDSIRARFGKSAIAPASSPVDLGGVRHISSNETSEEDG